LGSWGRILEEVKQSAAQHAGAPQLDEIRLRYIQRVRELSGDQRAVIVYASGWLSGPGDVQAAVEGGDVHALMESCHEVEDRALDLIIHSPGGSGQAAEQMVNYLRTQFDHIRAFVPLQAKSAATMIALGCDEIWLGRHSELGPIDPQILIPVPEGQRYAPAHAIIRDFERAKREIGLDVSALPAWTPILRSYAGGLLEYCNQQIELAQDVVAGWLSRYMLAHDDAGIAEVDRAQRAREIAEYFGSDEAYDRFRTHGRPIRIEELREIDGLRIRALEDDHDLQDAVLSLYHALDITFGGPAIKIVENHLGARYVRLQQQLIIPAQPVQPQQPAGAPPQAPGVPQPATPSRAERRRQERESRKR
jgi:hypothetical protein